MMSVCCVVKEMEGQCAVLSRRWRVSVLCCQGGGGSVCCVVGGWKVSDVSVLCCQGDGRSVMSVCCVVRGMEGQ